MRLINVLALLPAVLASPDTIGRNAKLLRIKSEISALTVDANSGGQWRRKLDDLKSNDCCSLWYSTNIEPYRVGKKDLLLITRSSFDTEDYLTDIVRSVKKRSNSSLEMAFNLVSFLSLIYSVFILPSTSLPLFIKNSIGVVSLLSPFIVISLSILFPGWGERVENTWQPRERIKNRDRIIYHEAGHFLAGYLCGVPVVSYDVTGENDAGIAILTEESLPARSIGCDKRSYLGSLLIVSMAGVVAETLYFGDSKGGVEDFISASEILRKHGIAKEDFDPYLRWALMKALILLRLHRDSLEEVTTCMRENKSIVDCIYSIEAGTLND